MLEAALMGEIPREAAGSFDEVVRQRKGQVLRTAFRILGNWADAEDVAQEVFLRLHRSGLVNKQEFSHEAVVGAWLYRVTVNLCFDRTRARRPTQELSDVPSLDRSAEAGSAGEPARNRAGAAAD